MKNEKWCLYFSKNRVPLVRAPWCTMQHSVQTGAKYSLMVHNVALYCWSIAQTHLNWDWNKFHCHCTLLNFKDIIFLEKACYMPTVDEHSSVSPISSTYYFEDVIFYTCDSGFVPISGESKRQCLENSTWSGQALQCISKFPKCL